MIVLAVGELDPAECEPLVGDANCNAESGLPPIVSASKAFNA